MQSPLHSADVNTAPSPYCPAGHGLHSPTPPGLNDPGGHGSVVALTEPSGHAYPGKHTPLHAAVDSAAVAPYLPAPHALHAADPDALNDPG